MNLIEILKDINTFIWGLPLLIMLIGCGGYLTYKLRFIQFRELKHGVWTLFKQPVDWNAEGDVSPIASLLLALAATIGMGNVIGVASAIKIGGAGALFWMWIAGLLGMATQYAEALLSVKYRKKDRNGNMLGGPMIYLDQGLKMPLLGKMFAIFAIGTSLLGTGNFSQSQTINNVFNSVFNIPLSVTSIFLGAIVAFLAFTGIKNLTRMAVITIPFIILMYLFGSSVIIFANIEQVPGIFIDVLTSAFSLEAVSGGLAGTGIAIAIKQGFRRGTFSSEAGMGSTPIAAAIAKTHYPAQQGTLFMLVAFVDTMIINTLTGFLILVSGTHLMSLSPNDMVFKAFDYSVWNLGMGQIILTVSIVFFTFTTLITWQFYGERCVVYLLGHRAVPIYKVLFIGVVIMGGNISSEWVWITADIGNALMVIPNVIALVLLTPVVVEETKRYHLDRLKK